MSRFFITLLLMVASATSNAEIRDCTTAVKGNITSLQYDTDDSSLYENYSFREIFFRGWGEITCPALVTLRHLTPDLTDIERTAFCLNYDKDKNTYMGYSIGVRNAYLGKL